MLYICLWTFYDITVCVYICYSGRIVLATVLYNWRNQSERMSMIQKQLFSLIHCRADQVVCMKLRKCFCRWWHTRMSIICNKETATFSMFSCILTVSEELDLKFDFKIHHMFESSHLVSLSQVTPLPSWVHELDVDYQSLLMVDIFVTMEL